MPGLIDTTNTILGNLPVDPSGSLSASLGRHSEFGHAGLDNKHILEALLTHLDAQRGKKQPKNGGLHPYTRRDNGRREWLCQEHHELYQREKR